MSSERAWERHYTRGKSVLAHPDENLVRMLAPWLAEKDMSRLAAADIGCGTGRHLRLFLEYGIPSPAGLDTSANALAVCRDLYHVPVLRGDARALPFKEGSLDLAVAWGSLHYTIKEDLPVMLAQIRRALKAGGRLFATLRNSRDTYLKKGTHRGNDVWVTDLADIEHSVVSFYAEEEVRSALAPFARFAYGMMERTLPGDMNARIAHWYFWAER
ncbi:MAG: class I SAM-dependent methyltransferase [Spirochaetes bacterium]|nr:MAG: class I SAM-dependent methyltransferase [Spirochaetota bacterium]